MQSPKVQVKAMTVSPRPAPVDACRAHPLSAAAPAAALPAEGARKRRRPG